MLTTNKTFNTASFLPKIVEAALLGNQQRLELLILSAIRAYKSTWPDVAEELGNLLSQYSGKAYGLRSGIVEPPPTDADAGLALVRLMPSNDAPEPLFDAATKVQVGRFLQQRKEDAQLMKEGFLPPCTVLLKGPPGTGKTMLARWLARNLGLQMVVLDLATAISSFLGKTGANLRRSLDYARATPCLLLLDEFDAIGKRRDDITEVGELKRIVNVLLKELEEWPSYSVLVAATNHPELLDPAINRRFDVVWDIPLPGTSAREGILERSCGRFAAELPSGFLSALSCTLKGLNGSELDTLAQTAIRQHLVDKTPLVLAFIDAIVYRQLDLSKEALGPLIKGLKNDGRLTVREIAALTGKSSSTVQYHLTK